jgi:hypothetical protein
MSEVYKSEYMTNPDIQSTDSFRITEKHNRFEKKAKVGVYNSQPPCKTRSHDREVWQPIKVPY